MFKEQLKKQYRWFYGVGLFFATLNLFFSGFREPIIIDIVVNLIMVGILSFVAFCIVFCASWIGDKVGTSKQGLKILVVLLLFGGAFLSPSVADAQTIRDRINGQRSGDMAKGGVIGFILANEFRRSYNNVRDSVVDTGRRTAKKVWDFVVSDNTPDCSSCKAGCSSCPSNGSYNGYSGSY